MQTASDMSQFPPHLTNPTSKKSNGLVIACFIIGIILFVLSLIYSFFSPYIPTLLNRNNVSHSMISMIMMVISLFFGLSGLLGLILGIIGLRQMIRLQPPYDYFRSVAGIALCFHSAVNLLTLLATLIGSVLIDLFGLL